MTVRGRVLDPEGKPVAGAEVLTVHYFWKTTHYSVPLTTVKSDEQGQFHLAFRKSQLDPGAADPTQSVSIIARLPGSNFGLAWSDYHSAKAGEEQILKLADDVPLEGRVVDLEGNPIAGVEVSIGLIFTNEGHDLSKWLEALGNGVPFFASKEFDQPRQSITAEFLNGQVKTDRNGHYRIAGLGRDCVVQLFLSGPGIVATELRQLTRKMDPLQVDYTSAGGPRVYQTYYGTPFDYAAEPSQPIEGTVRDSKSHEPLSGVQVFSNRFAGSNFVGNRLVKTISDNQGNFRLDGMPKGEGNQILAIPTDEQPYLMQEFKVPAAPGLDTVKLDLDLHRGVLIEGRVTDKISGVPLEGARMHFVPWPDNPNIIDLPQFNHGDYSLPGPQGRYETDRDGRFTIVGIPGRSLLEVECSDRPYPQGQGFREMIDLPKREEFEKVAGVFAPTAIFPTAVKQLEIKTDEPRTHADFQLDRGKSVRLNVVDPEGNPLSDVEAQGLWPKAQSHFASNAGPAIDVEALWPDEKRLVLLYSQPRNLGKAVYVSWQESGAGPVTVKLEPCATLKARLLDQHGDPAPIARCASTPNPAIIARP